MTVQTFRKKPVEIQAMRFDGLSSYFHIVEWMKECGDTHALANEIRYSTPIMLIQTIEGATAANPGDWIIRGVKSEFYPCKPDIFAEKYEPAAMASGPQISDKMVTAYRDAWAALPVPATPAERVRAGLAAVEPLLRDAFHVEHVEPRADRSEA